MSSTGRNQTSQVCACCSSKSLLFVLRQVNCRSTVSTHSESFYGTGALLFPSLYEALEGHSLLSFLWEMHETKWIFFFYAPLFFPFSAHSRHSRCASVHSRGAAIVFLSTSRGSKERLIRFDERCVHAWAPMSPAMRQLCSRSSRLWCHLLNDEVGRSLLVEHPPPLYTHTYTLCVILCSSLLSTSGLWLHVIANSSVHQISSSVITRIKFSRAIMPVVRAQVNSRWPRRVAPPFLDFLKCDIHTHIIHNFFFYLGFHVVPAGIVEIAA